MELKNCIKRFKDRNIVDYHIESCKAQKSNLRKAIQLAGLARDDKNRKHPLQKRV